MRDLVLHARAPVESRELVSIRTAVERLGLAAEADHILRSHDLPDPCATHPLRWRLADVARWARRRAFEAEARRAQQSPRNRLQRRDDLRTTGLDFEDRLRDEREQRHWQHELERRREVARRAIERTFSG